MKHTTTKPRAPRFDREWTEMISLLPESRREILTKAIREYQINAVEPRNLEGAELMAFLLIKKIVDRRSRQRQARLRKKAEATSIDRQPQLQTSADIEPPVIHYQETAGTLESQPIQPEIQIVTEKREPQSANSKKRTGNNTPAVHKNQNKKPNPHLYLRRLVDRHNAGKTRRR